MVNKRFRQFVPGVFIFFVFQFFLFSCKTDRSDNLPSSAGNTGNVLVVIENNLWNSAIGDSIKKSLTEAQYGLPQPEPLFTLNQISPSNFNRLYRIQKNILMVSIPGENPNESAIKIRKNVWARGQLVIEMQFPDKESFYQTFENSMETVKEKFNQIELKRLTERFEKFDDKELTKKIQRQHEITMTLKEGFVLAENTDNFVWLKLEQEKPLGGYQHQISQGIMIYYYPYSDTKMFSKEHLLEVRDSITKKYIPGPVEGSYMTTSYQWIPPKAEEKEINGEYMLEMRGLWKVEKHFMGGPFVSITTLDEKRNRIVTAEGYVYAPQFDKREFLREVEAMIKSIKFSEDSIQG